MKLWETFIYVKNFRNSHYFPEILSVDKIFKWPLQIMKIMLSFRRDRMLPHWVQEVSCTYVKCLGEFQNVFWTSYVLSIYALYPGGSEVHYNYFISF